MDELLQTLAVKLSTKTPENVLDLEWDSDEAIRQVDEIYRELGQQPDYINTNSGGSVRWFDITKPMSFSEVYVEDQIPTSLIRGVSYNSSFTIMLHIENRKILKRVPKDLVTYNHNYSRITCHCSSWKEAVVIASAVYIMDLGRFDQFEPIWNAFKDMEDPTPFVNLLIGEDPQENEDENEENIDEIEENEDEENINKIDPIEPIDKITPSSMEDIESPSIVLNPSTPSNTKKLSPVEQTKIPSRDPTPMKHKSRETSPAKNKKSIKSPLGNPINRAHKSQSPRSPVRTIAGRSSIPLEATKLVPQTVPNNSGFQKMSLRPTSNLNPQLASLIRRK